MASISPGCPEVPSEPRRESRSCWRQQTGLRLRPVPELEICLVYRRDPPKLFRLTPEVALVLALAGTAPAGRPEAALLGDYASRWPETASAQLAASFVASLALLRAERLVVAAEDAGNRQEMET